MPRSQKVLSCLTKPLSFNPQPASPSILFPRRPHSPAQYHPASISISSKVIFLFYPIHSSQPPLHPRLHTSHGLLLHPRLQLIHLYLRALTLALRVLYLPFEPLDLAIYELEAGFDG